MIYVQFACRAGFQIGYFEIQVKQKNTQKWSNDWRWRRSGKIQFLGDFRTLSAQVNYHLVDKCSCFVLMYCFLTENIILIEKIALQWFHMH